MQNKKSPQQNSNTTLTNHAPTANAISGDVADKNTLLDNAAIQKLLTNNVIAIYDLWKNTYISQSEIKDEFILSVSDGVKRAKVITFEFTDFNNNPATLENFLTQVFNYTHKLQKKFKAPIIWLKIEWVNKCQKMSWQQFNRNLKKYKRNYFRNGIAFQGIKQPWLLLTEMELNANAALYGGSDVPTPEVNLNNFKKYFKARHGSSQMPSFDAAMPIYVFATSGVFIDTTTKTINLMSALPRQHGRRHMPPLDTIATAELIFLGTKYLANQVLAGGKYNYGYFPCFNRKIDFYNTLRHASSTYALIEGYEFCRKQLQLADANKKANADKKVSTSEKSITEIKSSKVNNADIGAQQKLSLVLAHSSISPYNITKSSLAKMSKQIGQALDYLCDVVIKEYGDLAYVIEQNGEIKLGANAVAILAIVKYLDVFNDKKRRANLLNMAEKLACGIINMQQDDGSFVHVLHGKDLSLKAKTRTIYYDGEAAFALMRLYGVTKDSRWLDCVTFAFDYFIAAKHHTAHDHWLSYCSNELVIYKPEKKYFKFAVDNVKGFTNFIKTRITTYPTLLELSMAFHKMLLKLDEYPEFYEVLDGFDVQDFYQALHTRANYLLNGFFFPEMAMFYKAPQTILHGFFIRHHAFRVRIDDVEHYLSGYVAYHEFIKQAKYPKVAARPYRPQLLLDAPNNTTSNTTSSAPILNANNLAAVTKGRWIVAPKDDWCATGLCIWPPSFELGHMVVARSKHMKLGYLPKVAIQSLVKKGASAIITDDASEYMDMGVPVLQVGSVRQSTLLIGQFARFAFEGKVIGITGSAGKTTTVAMLSHTLQQFGAVGQSEASANLPAGIAWNMASLSQNDDYWVIEMAIGGMSTNSDMVRPNIALITNIAPAHLEYHHTLDNIAIKKARIFEAMAPGSLAIVCRDIPQFDIIKQLATLQGIHIVSYGEHEKSDIRLLSYQQDKTIIAIADSQYTLNLQAAGKHMVLNAMATLAVLQHSNLSIDEGIKRLEDFTAIAGRGQVVHTVYRSNNHADKHITVYDDAYNANPLSMQAAMQTFADVNVPAKQKLLIIGDMLELGSDSRAYHLQLVDDIVKVDCRAVILVGKRVAPLVAALTDRQPSIAVSHFLSTTELSEVLADMVQEGDHILIKASHGIGLGKLFIADAKQKSINNQGDVVKVGDIQTTAAIVVNEVDLQEIESSKNISSKNSPLENKPISLKTIVAIKPRQLKSAASLAKLVTSMLIWDKIKQNNLDVTKEMVLMPVDLLPGSGEEYQFFSKGEQVAVIELLKAMLIVSSNEAAFALAHWHMGSEKKFVQQMNQKTQSLGLDNSYWTSSSGLDRKAYTTAEDMGVLGAVYINQYAKLSEFCAEKTYEYGDKTKPNTNRLLLNHDNVKGLKTGNLVGIGANLINYWIADNKHYISVVLCAEKRRVCFDLSEWLMMKPEKINSNNIQ